MCNATMNFCSTCNSDSNCTSCDATKFLKLNYTGCVSNCTLDDDSSLYYILQ